MKELREIQRIQQQYHHDPVFTVELVNDNLFEWHVRLYRIDSESELASDMKDMGIPYILLHLMFPDNFPFAPPFMRVISPRIEKGFVMEGGAICMELLTPRGWASAYTVEAIVMQFAASIVKGQVCLKCCSVDEKIVIRHVDRLCGLVVSVPGHRSIGPGFDSGATRFSEK
jgi:ubiquitin-conjugating enzyme E2 Q